MPTTLAPQRKQTIAAEVLRTIAPKAEAPDSVRGLQRQISRGCGDPDPQIFCANLVGKLVRPIDTLIQSGSISGDKARTFIVDVVSEIPGTSMETLDDKHWLFAVASCAAPSQGDRMHRHRCSECGEIWEHSSHCGGIKEAHECPKCGKLEWYHYLG